MLRKLMEQTGKRRLHTGVSSKIFKMNTQVNGNSSLNDQARQSPTRVGEPAQVPVVEFCVRFVQLK